MINTQPPLEDPSQNFKDFKDPLQNFTSYCKISKISKIHCKISQVTAKFQRFQRSTAKYHKLLKLLKLHRGAEFEVAEVAQTEVALTGVETQCASLPGLIDHLKTSTQALKKVNRSSVMPSKR
ncbi:unnamed protein product [Phytophthora fragariaefolia]|uniref:Unnamed protein product n=1 Tax=Phytophthora fragariaefolia TaxID=1490495 RepID=A0A9W7D5Y7_9STRA|nr:unnamed protein product [Phytophthora fragariaefolia]